MWNQLMSGLRITLALTIFTGLVYPGLVTGLCQLIFPYQANGSLIVKDGRVAGSSLLGQVFTKAEYFHSRPSHAGAEGYDASASRGSNFGATSKKLFDRVQASVEEFRKGNPEYTGPIPADLVTASSSGLDPHISPESAHAQAARVARARGISLGQVKELVARHTEGRDFGVLGEPRVNVLLLNLALDREFAKK